MHEDNVEEIIDYLLDFVLPRKASPNNALNSDLTYRLNSEIDLKVTNKTGSKIGNSNHDKLILSCHNYLEGAVWNSGLIDLKGNVDENIGLVVYSALYAETSMKNLIHRAKFKSEWAIAKQIGSKLGVFLNTVLKNNTLLGFTSIIVTYIPPDKKRLKERGFHLPQIIAKQAFLELNKYEPQVEFDQLLTKLKNTPRQTELTKTERQKNIENIFKINTNIKINRSIDSVNNYPTRYDGKLNSGSEFEENKVKKLIILVDDVVTTGSTLGEAIKTIKAYYKVEQEDCVVIGLCWLFAE